MNTNQPMKIVIVGGGSAGWMSAAFLSRVLREQYDIRLVESDDISTIGVGEATIPAIGTFNQILKINEADFIKKTQATFKLGIKFQDWKSLGSSYIHGFGKIGREWEHLRVHQYWLKMYLAGEVSDFRSMAINTVAPEQNKFMPANVNMKESPLSEIVHAYHLDAGLYAKYLRGYSEERGVKRTEGKVVDVKLRSEDGFVEHIKLESGEIITGDLFIDCSGFRGLIIEQAMKTGYEDWSQWLFADSAIAVPCVSDKSFPPYTLSTALKSGWQWKIPLQHRTGNGHVYSSQFIDHKEAEEILLNNLEGAPLAEPNRLRFTVGKRKNLWNKNCVAVGLSGGFLEPIESTGLHMIQAAMLRLIRFFPDKGFNQSNIDEFNRLTNFDFERIRDFIVLHYKATTRDDSPFWRHCRDAAIPDSLQNKIDIFKANGRVNREGEELFAEESWIQVFLGQGIIPTNYDPLVDLKSEKEIREFIENTGTVIQKCVATMPAHKDFIEKYCKADPI